MRHAPRSHRPLARALALCLPVLLAGFMTCGCSTVTITEEQPRTPVGQLVPAKLAIVHTSGSFDPTDEERDHASLALASAHAQELAGQGFDVLLLDGGNALAGTELADLTYGEEAIGLLNGAGCQALALSGGELSLGAGTLALRSRQADFPFLSANVTQAEGVEPRQVVTLSDGRKIGLFALTDPASCTEGAASLTGLAASEDDLAACAGAQVSALRAEDCRLIVCLTDIDEPSARALAEGASGIDVLLAASGEEPGWQVVTDASGDETLLVTTPPTAATTNVVTWSRGALSCAPFEAQAESPANEQVDALATQAALELEQRMAQTVADSAFALEAHAATNGESALGDLVADALLWQARRDAKPAPDVALIPLDALAAGLVEGELTQADVLAVAPHATSRLCIVELSGSQLASLLAEPNLTSPQVAGMTLTLGEDGALSVDEVGDKPFSPEGTYTLATTVPTLLACLSSEPALRADAPVQLLEASAGGSLASYLAHECKGTVPERYQQPQGRIAPSAQKGEAAQGS